MEHEDDDEPIVQATDEANRRTLVVKLLNPKVYESRTLSLALPKAWRLTGSVRSTTLAHDSEVQFFFESESDLLWVLNQEPWCFNDWMLVMDRFSEREKPEFLRFISFWVEMFGIPSDCRGTEVIKEIGSVLGQVLEVENEGPGVRARIRIDTSKGLDFVRHVVFEEDGEPVGVRFVYEGLRMFCQACGCLTHHKSVCPHPRT